MPGAQGETTLTFPATGDTYATASVSGQTGLTTAGKVEAWFMGVDSSNNTVDDHALASTLCKPVATVTGAGAFTIRAVSLEPLSGNYTVQWVWNE